MIARRVPNERAGQARRECPECVPVHVPGVSRMSVASVPDRVPSPFGTPHTHHRCACPESGAPKLPFDASSMVRCHDYHAHQTSHHRDGIGWTCGICQVTP